MTRILQALAVAVLLALPAQPVTAQENGTDTRVFGQFILGFAGEASVDLEATGISEEIENDLDVSPGFGVGADFGVHEYIALGLMFRFLSMSGEGSSVDVTVLDFDLLPRLRYPFKRKAGEIYLGVPVGLSLFMADMEGAEDELGWNISVVMGGLFRLSENFGVFTELGYLIHNVEESQTVAGMDVDMSTSLGQIGLSIGAAYID